jgi:hypothetical protein
MATTLQYPLRIKQTLTQTGTGTQVFVNNDTAISGFETLNSTLSTTGQWFRYTIEDGTAYEVGSAYWNASVSYPSFYRYPIKSSNSNNRIDLSGNAVLFATTTDFEVSPKQLLSSNNAVTTSIYQGQYLEATGSTEYGSRNTYSYVALNRYHYVGGGTGESGWSGSIFFHHHHDEYGSDQYPIIRSIGGYINTSNDPTTHQSFVNYLDYSDIYGFYLYLSSTGGFESGGYKVYGLF